MLWVTPLEIPARAEHPTDAHLFMDWFYRPQNAVPGDRLGSCT